MVKVKRRIPQKSIMRYKYGRFRCSRSGAYVIEVSMWRHIYVAMDILKFLASLCVSSLVCKVDIGVCVDRVTNLWAFRLWRTKIPNQN
jgi:hypothetical protein